MAITAMETAGERETAPDKAPTYWVKVTTDDKRGVFNVEVPKVGDTLTEIRANGEEYLRKRFERDRAKTVVVPAGVNIPVSVLTRTPPPDLRAIAEAAISKAIRWKRAQDAGVNVGTRLTAAITAANTALEAAGA